MRLPAVPGLAPRAPPSSGASRASPKPTDSPADLRAPLHHHAAITSHDDAGGQEHHALDRRAGNGPRSRAMINHHRGIASATIHPSTTPARLFLVLQQQQHGRWGSSGASPNASAHLASASSARRGDERTQQDQHRNRWRTAPSPQPHMPTTTTNADPGDNDNGPASPPPRSSKPGAYIRIFTMAYDTADGTPAAAIVPTYHHPKTIFGT